MMIRSYNKVAKLFFLMANVAREPRGGRDRTLSRWDGRIKYCVPRIANCLLLLGYMMRKPKSHYTGNSYHEA